MHRRRTGLLLPALVVGVGLISLLYGDFCRSLDRALTEGLSPGPDDRP